MPHLRIADLLTNAPIDPEAHLNAAKVERYAEMLDALPPVVVFDTEEGLLLADGYHRVEAARRRGLRRSKTRCVAARATMRCGTPQRWTPHSAVSPLTTPLRTPGVVARDTGPQSAEFPRMGCAGNRVTEKNPFLDNPVNEGNRKG